MTEDEDDAARGFSYAEFERESNRGLAFVMGVLLLAGLVVLLIVMTA